jgi:hypothetical protein
MAFKTKDGKYQCSYCLKKYDDPVRADACREEHDLIYLPLTREDIFALNAFLATKNDDYLTETLVRQVRKHRKLTQRVPKRNR